MHAHVWQWMEPSITACSKQPIRNTRQESSIVDKIAFTNLMDPAAIGYFIKFHIDV